MITREEFILTVQGIPISAGDLYVHFDDIANTILGVAVHVTTVDTLDLTDILRQVQQIRFVITKGGSSQQVVLDVTNRANFTTFFHCDVVPFPLTVSILDNDTVSYTISNVQFSPAVLESEYYNSDYNAVQNNVNSQRVSTFLQVAERDRLADIPTNSDAIAADTARRAEIPDSNYTVAGWIQSRYLGSTTDVTSYNNIPGALAGSTFIGSLHPPTTPTGSVCALASYDRVLQTFIHTGTQDYPTFEVGKPFKVLSTQGIDANDTVLKATLTNTSAPIVKYDLLLISSSLAEEIVRVLDYNVQAREIIVERGIGESSPTTFAAGTFQIRPVRRNQIYKVEGSKAVALTDSWIWVKDPLSLVLTDKYGIVYKQAACPEIIYFRPQG